MKNTKKLVLFTGLFGTALFLLLVLIQTNDICYTNKICNSWWPVINFVGNFLIFFIPVFVFSLITYFLREEIFRSWIKFTYYWIPISIFLVFIIPGGGGNGAFPSLIDKETVSILMSGLYFIVSLIIIIWLSIKYYWFKRT